MSMFQARHYRAIAETVKRRYQGTSPQGERIVLRIVMWDLADLFEKDSTKFNRPRFLDACGLNDYLREN